MNKTQKSAWFCLASFSLGVAIIAYVLMKIFLLKTLPEGFAMFVLPLAYFGFIVVAVLFMRKKQSPAEVDSDERDNVIKGKAVKISFVCGWILLAFISLFLELFAGAGGTIPVWLWTIINVSVFMAVMLIYNVATLIQYGWKEKNNE